MAAGPGDQGLRHAFRLGGALARHRSHPVALPVDLLPAATCDSTLIVLERLGQDELPRRRPWASAEVVQAAFGQRRKTLVNALSAGLNVTRDVVAGAVRTLGLSPDVRAERLEPGQFVRLAEELQRLRDDDPAALGARHLRYVVTSHE